MSVSGDRFEMVKRVPPSWRVTASIRQLVADARLRDVIIAIRADEARHHDVNHEFSDKLAALDKP